MDLDEIKETETWQLYTKGVNFLRQNHVYSDTDVNYRMYNGNQWEGVILDGVEPVQYNFIETIVNYKVSTINSNLWAMNFSSENFENRDLLKEAGITSVIVMSNKVTLVIENRAKELSRSLEKLASSRNSNK